MPVPGTHAPPTHAQVVTAFAANAPASTTAALEVTIPAFGAERSLVLGWAPRATLPKVGDACLVAYDEGGNPWVIAWLNVGEAPLVTALPSSPYNGQTIAYQSAAMATAGVVWRLRYNAASASAYKWEFLGGGRLEAKNIAGRAKAVTANTTTTIEGPSITVPLAGDYEVEHSTLIACSTTSIPVLLAIVAVAGTGKASCAANAPAIGGFRVWLCQTVIETGIAASTVVDQRYQSNLSETITIEGSRLLLRPVRVG